MNAVVVVIVGLVVHIIMLVLEVLSSQRNSQTKSKPENTAMSWALEVFTGLVVGIILLLIEYYILRR